VVERVLLLQLCTVLDCGQRGARGSEKAAGSQGEEGKLFMNVVTNNYPHN